jgi:amino-acid N-acetyltransferase
MRPTLREATTADWPAIASLLRANDLPTDGFEESVSAAVVACKGDSIVGVAGLEIYGDAALLRSVAVDDCCRGLGLGRQLTREAMRMAAARLVARVYLLTTTAEAFFSRLGFARVERSSVPGLVHQSVEFRGACPATATVMCAQIGNTE